jgi:Skp family chaperone for outer membrane proteins
LPDVVFQRVNRIAEGLRQPVQQTLLKIVEAGLPSLAKVPLEYQSEMQALEAASDEELEEIARGEMPAAQQRQLERLLRKNQAEGLSEKEQQSLEQLHTAANRLMLQKSYAYVLLQWRGHQTPRLTGL